MSLWPGVDAVSTFSREFEVENGVVLNEQGERDAFTWKCAVSKREVRLVPNCMLAPCRALDNPVTNPYFDGEATMECTCPLIQANDDYNLFGGLQDPCDEPALVNVGGPTPDENDCGHCKKPTIEECLVRLQLLTPFLQFLRVTLMSQLLSSMLVGKNLSGRFLMHLNHLTLRWRQSFVGGSTCAATVPRLFRTLRTLLFGNRSCL